MARPASKKTYKIQIHEVTTKTLLIKSRSKFNATTKAKKIWKEEADDLHTSKPKILSIQVDAETATAKDKKKYPIYKE